MGQGKPPHSSESLGPLEVTQKPQLCGTATQPAPVAVAAGPAAVLLVAAVALVAALTVALAVAVAAVAAVVAPAGPRRPSAERLAGEDSSPQKESSASACSSSETPHRYAPGFAGGSMALKACLDCIAAALSTPKPEYLVQEEGTP